MNNKYCPLLSISAEDSLVECQGELCAWYVPPVYAHNGKLLNEGCCAVQMLGVLPEVAKGVRSL